MVCYVYIYSVFYYNVILLALHVISDTSTLELCAGQCYTVTYSTHCPVLVVMCYLVVFASALLFRNV